MGGKSNWVVRSHQVDVTAQHLFRTLRHHRKGEVLSVDQNELIQYQWFTSVVHIIFIPIPVDILGMNLL